MKDTTKLEPGLYVGIRRSLRSFYFALPKVGAQRTAETPEELFFGVFGKSEKKGSDEKNKADGIQTTTFSGWSLVTNPKVIGEKIRQAPYVYENAEGEEGGAATSVANFKKKAAKVLAEYADSEKPVDQEMADRINESSCVVHEMKIVFLYVAKESFEGSRFDKNTELHYQEKVVRKFYVNKGTNKEGLNILLDNLISDDCVVTQTNLFVSRSGENKFRFASKLSEAEEDQRLHAAIERMKALMTPPS